MALFYAFKWVLDDSVHKLVVEGKINPQFMQTMAGGYVEDRSKWGLCVQDCCFLRSHFRFVRFFHMQREANAASHVLTRYAKDIDQDMVRIEGVPEFTKNIAQKEAISVLN